MNRPRPRFPAPKLLIPLVMLLLSLGTVQPARAHGFLVRAIPDDRAVLDRAPVRVQYWFSEPLEPDFSSLTVRDPDGNLLASGGVTPENLSLISARLPANLPDGAYIVDLRLAFASDGHVIAQSQVFFVGQAVGGVSGQSAGNTADPLEVLWRALTLSSVILLFGAFTLYSVILVPAWGNPSHRAGLLPPRVMRRLSAVIILALVVAVAGNTFGLLQQSMAFFNARLDQVITQNLWSVARAGTRFGDLWTARTLLLLLVALSHGLSLYWRDERPATVRPFWTANAWALALVLGSFSAGSHAAGSLLWPWVAVITDWLHLLAVGFWAGSLGALALVLPVALAPLEGEPRRAALLAALSRFSRLATICLALVVTTGIYSALNWFYTPADVTRTPFGGSLIFKSILVAGLLLVGLTHYLALRPALYRRWSGLLAGLIERIQTFIPTLRLEAFLAVLVIASAGLLTATPVPIPDFVQDAPPAPSASLAVDGWDVTLTISPGGPGINTYDVLVSQSGQPVQGLAVRLQVVNPARDQRSAWETAEDTGDGLFISADAAIDRADNWWTLVDLTTPDGVTRRAAFSWQITGAAAVLQSRSPNLLNLLALAGVLAAVGFALYPFARRLYHRLDLSPASVAVALAAGVAALLLSGFAIVMIGNTQAQYEAALNPLPQRVNPVLPSQESLDAGQSMYEQSCDWSGTILTELVTRLPRTRDEELFQAAQSGWRGLPPCADLPDEDRWNIVNYVRTFERTANN